MTLLDKRAQTLALARAPEAERRRVIAGMTWQDVLITDAEYERWVSDGQIEPKGDGWRTCLMMAGRGFGKTRAGAEWINGLARARPGARIALVGATLAEARSVMVEGVSGLLAVARSQRRKVEWEPSLGRLRWSNGTEAHLFSGDSADGLRGPEHDFAWCDELAKWRQADEAWDNLQMGLRRGVRSRALITTTPRPIGLLNRIKAESWTAITHGKTGDNINLDSQFVDIMTATYAGTRVGAQELDGVLLDDVEGALWTRAMFERGRIAEILPRPGKWRPGGLTEGAVRAVPCPLHHAAHGPPPRSGEDFDRIVVGVDPPVSEGSCSDACGIVVAGSRGETLYVLEDATVQGLSPEGWSNRVAAAAARWGTSQVIAEANNGGVLVASVLKAADLQLKVRLVHASKGKCARAEPIALKFEAGKAFFAGAFPELEAELAGMQAGGGYAGPSRSPDRADAMVWTMTVLSETRSGVPRVRRL